jgi:hypothetical protein
MAKMSLKAFSPKNDTQAIAGFYSWRLDLPFFALAQETAGSRVGEFFGYRDIDFVSH